MDKNKDLVKRIDKHNTYELTVTCLTEEMAELTKVLCKEIRKSPKFNENKLKEEVSHVLLMANVLVDNLQMTDEEIYEIQLDAVERMEANI